MKELVLSLAHRYFCFSHFRWEAFNQVSLERSYYHIISQVSLPLASNVSVVSSAEETESPSSPSNPSSPQRVSVASSSLDEIGVAPLPLGPNLNKEEAKVSEDSDGDEFHDADTYVWASSCLWQGMK